MPENVNSASDQRPVVSVVVCTYNRSAVLANALDTLCRQEQPTPEHEIIVVDNNSRDDTRSVVESFMSRGPVRYVLETRQGLSHARNCGWGEARADYVAYVDDDCRIPPTWLAAVAGVIQRVAPVAFGGPVFAFHTGPAPAWYKDTYHSAMPKPEAHELTQHEYLIGCNIVFRRDVLMNLGGFRPDLGMNGAAMGYGEETELLRRIRSQQNPGIVYYDPSVYVHHLVRLDKATLRWMAKHSFVDGQYVYRIFRPWRVVGLTRSELYRAALREAAGLAADTVRAVIGRDRSQYPYMQNYLCERTFKHLSQLGLLYEHYREARPSGNTAPLAPSSR